MFVDELDHPSEMSLLLFENARIETLSAIHNKHYHYYMITATLKDVQGNHYVQLMIGEDHTIKQQFCNCYLSSSSCEHKNAVILFLNTIAPTQFPFVYHRDSQDRQDFEINQQIKQAKHKRLQQIELIKTQQFLIEQQKNYQEELMDHCLQQTIELYPSVEMDNNQLLLTYKIGRDRPYIIKNIKEFIENVQKENRVSYGKMLTFKHSFSNFSETAQQQIDLIKSILTYQIKDTFNIRKNLLIEGSELEMMSACYGEENNYNFIFEVDDYKPTILFEEHEDYYLAQLVSEKLLLGSNSYFRVIENETVYTFKKTSCNTQCIFCLSELMKHSFYIPKKQMNEFYKYTFASIEKYLRFENLPIDEKTHEDIFLYGDVNSEGKVVFYLEYLNSNHEIRSGFGDRSLNSYVEDVVENYLEFHSDAIVNHMAVFNEVNEKTLKVIKDGIPFLMNYCEVYVSESLKSVENAKKVSFKVGVSISGNLLNIDVDSDKIPKHELKDVLKAYRKKRKFYKLKNGELISLENEQFKQLDHLIEGASLNDDQFVLNKNKMFAIESILTNSELRVDREKNFIESIQQFNETSHPTLIPSNYETVLRDYQKVGFEWLCKLASYNFNGILADDMGLGKTLQVMALLEGQKDQKHPSIVVCPSSLVYNWQDELKKFNSSLQCICIVGNASSRKALIQSTADLFITSYDYMRRDVDQYQQTFNYVILDEAQYIKNQNTLNAISVKRLKGNHKLALSGTPIENSLAELWSIFDFLMPGYLFSYHYFQTHYENEIVRYQDAEVKQDLKRLVSPFILRRNKKDVLKELPDKIENTVALEFSEQEKKLYYANLATIHEELAQASAMQSGKFEILAMLTRLRQLCCEPRLVYDNISNLSSKLDGCMQLIRTIHENKQKVLVFSCFKSMLDLIAHELYREGISYCELSGSTSKEQRKKNVDIFQKEDSTVFLISLKAGGTGLNLTAASAVIHVDPWWNQSAQNQATDRAYRIGQNKKVNVYKLIMKDSIEEKIQQLQVAKKDLADAFVEGNEGSLLKMDKDDLLKLFEY